MCTLARATARSPSGMKASFACADGEFSSSEMSAMCHSLFVARCESEIDDNVPVSVEIDVSKKSKKRGNSGGCKVNLLYRVSTGAGGDAVAMQLGIDQDAISKSISRGDACFVNRINKNTVLDYYKIAAPRPEWLSRSSVLNGAGSSSFYRGRSVASRSVSLLAVMRLVGGPRNMATLVMMLLTGRYVKNIEMFGTNFY